MNRRFYTKKSALEWAFDQAEMNREKFGGFFPRYIEEEEKPWDIVFTYQIRTLSPNGTDRGDNTNDE